VQRERERAHEYLIPGSGESNVNSVRKPTAEGDRDEWRNTGDTGKDENQYPVACTALHVVDT